jgi:peptidyl-prolyl cis-trans isomerase SurA
MKRYFILLMLLAALAWGQAEVVDRIIARVGSDIILLSDLTKQISQMKSANMYGEDMTELEVLNQMIESKLIIQKARELNYTVDENKVKSAVESRIRKIKTQFATEEEYQRELKKMKLTNSDLMKYLQDMLTEQELTKEFFKNQIAVKVKVSDKEQRAFYEAHKDTLAVKPVTWEIGMILRQTEASDATDKAQLKAIKAIQERLKSGESFSSLAKAESQCPSAEKGGDLGFFTKGMMVKPFEDAAFALKVGEVSDIVRTEYGYHLIRLEEQRNDEIRVSHILRLVQPSKADSLAARQLMEDIRPQFLQGTPFDTLAVRWSMDKATAAEGGNIGEYSETDFPELFAPVLRSLQVGSISEVLENEGLLYLFTKSKEMPGRLMSFDEISAQIKDVITRQKQMLVYQDWIDQLKKENFVEILK